MQESYWSLVAKYYCGSTFHHGGLSPSSTSPCTRLTLTEVVSYEWSSLCLCLFQPDSQRRVSLHRLVDSSIREYRLFFCWESPLCGRLCQVLPTHLFFTITLFSSFFETLSERGLREGYLSLHLLCHRHTPNPSLSQITQASDTAWLHFSVLRGKMWALIKSIWLGWFF